MGATTLPFQLRGMIQFSAKGRKTMRRREFITLVGSAVAAWPFTAFGKTQRIAIVHPSRPVEKMNEARGDPFFQALFNELRRLGYVEGQSLLIERYSGEGRASYYADLARDVVSRIPDVIISNTNNLTLDFKAATTTIPIVGVFAVPVEAGIVASLARPGGNITGVSVDVGPEQWGKRVQLLQQVLPRATRLGFLQSRAVREYYGPKEESQWMGITWVGPLFDHPVDEAEYRRVFAALAIYPFKMFVQAGGLMSYGVDVPDLGRRVADMVGEILKGARPGEIPIFQPTKFELVINLKTAKALDLTVPAALLVAADEVIE
jgi:putative ABC transport system substrate-binding protein